MTTSVPTIESACISLGGHTFEYAFSTSSRNFFPVAEVEIQVAKDHHSISAFFTCTPNTFREESHIGKQAQEYFRNLKSHLYSSTLARTFMAEIDRKLVSARAASSPQSCCDALIFTATADGVEGASSGSIRAYIFGTKIIELTKGHASSPPIGGEAVPHEFSANLNRNDILIAASSGVWDRMSLDEAYDIVTKADGMDQAVARLLAFTRVPDPGAVPLQNIICLTVR